MLDLETAKESYERDGVLKAGMSEKPPIVVFVPFMKPHETHLIHFTEWYAANKARHHIRLIWIFYRSLHQAQGFAVKTARQWGASHILFTEDDQWRYPIDGLDVLLEADRDVIGFKSYFKKYPFLSMAMRRRTPGEPLDLISRTQRLRQVEGITPGADPIQAVDLLSWAFTLVKMSVFDRMAEAGKDPFEQWGKVPTDSYFCQACWDLGIERYVHFGFTIGHGDVPPEQIHHHRRLIEAVHLDKKMMQPRLITLEDDAGLPYGQAVWEPEPARIMRQVQERNGTYPPREEQVRCDFPLTVVQEAPKG